MAKGKYEYWLTPEGQLLLRSWARDGLYDEQIAKNCDISPQTLSGWKNAYPEIREALKRGREIADYEVENALFKKCTGSWVKEEKAFKCKSVYYDDAGRRCEEEEIKTTIVDTFIPPDTVAQLAWLNNRRPDKWRRNAGKERLDVERFEHEKKNDEKKYW